MIALCSKTYILKTHEDAVKFSSKGLNKTSLTDPFDAFNKVLQTRQPHSASNQGFRTRDNTIYTYQQTKTGLSYFYCKRQVLNDGVHTKPLDIVLSPWPERQVDVVDANHPWNLQTSRQLVVGDKRFNSLAQLVESATEDEAGENMVQQMLEAAFNQLPPHNPIGVVLVPLPPSWKKDRYWTTGLSPKASPLRVNTPGQNKLGNILQNVYNLLQQCIDSWDNE